MSSLIEAIDLVRSRIEQYRHSKTMTEQNTKASLIDPILRAIGWDVEDVEEVVHEYRRRQNHNPVDYAMRIMRQPRLFVEAKALSKSLEDAKWTQQILTYAVVAGVQWAVLTNGDEYRLYNTHATVPVERKLFRSFRISDPNSPIEEVLALLSKNQLSENTIDILWRAHYVDRQVENIIFDLFAGAPDAALVKLIQSKSDKVPMEDIVSSLQRARIHIDYPITTRIDSKILRQAKPKQRSLRKDPAVTKISLLAIIEAGLISLPLALETIYKGKTVRATIEAADQVRFMRSVVPSLSSAAGIARKHVLGLPKGKKAPSTNGWAFWKFADSSGNMQAMDTLRHKYLAMNKTF